MMRCVLAVLLLVTAGPIAAQPPPNEQALQLEADIEAFIRAHTAHVVAEDVDAYLDDVLHDEVKKSILRAQAERIFAEHDLDITIDELFVVEKNAQHARVVLTQRTLLTHAASGATSETLTRLNLTLRNLDGKWRIATTERVRLDP